MEASRIILASMQHQIIIIGGGNMGGAIAQRLHRAEGFTVGVIEQDAARREACAASGVHAHATLTQAPQADIYLLAIKPQQFADYASELKTAFGDRTPLLVSIMAGVPLAALQKVSTKAIRVMPNLPAIINESMSVLCAPTLDAPTRDVAEAMFASIGAVAWVEDEEQLHVVTAISGSGPGYVFAFMEALQAAAVAQDLSPQLARRLVTQTLRGAALLADQSSDGSAALRQQVTSKGGTTEAALNIFAEGNLLEMVNKAVAAAALRSRQLAE
ncbi:MAG: pyrroline-5-carboxylate reductase [Rickettsiales bacterium]